MWKPIRYILDSNLKWWFIYYNTFTEVMLVCLINSPERGKPGEFLVCEVIGASLA